MPTFLTHSLIMHMLIKSNTFYFPLLRISIPALATPQTGRNHCRPCSSLEQPLVSMGKGTWMRPPGFDGQGGSSHARLVRDQFHLCRCLRVAAEAPVERPQLRKPPRLLHTTHSFRLFPTTPCCHHQKKQTPSLSSFLAGPLPLHPCIAREKGQCSH